MPKFFGGYRELILKLFNIQYKVVFAMLIVEDVENKGNACHIDNFIRHSTFWKSLKQSLT